MKRLFHGEKNGKKYGIKYSIVRNAAVVIKTRNDMITVFYDGKCGLESIAQ